MRLGDEIALAIPNVRPIFSGSDRSSKREAEPDEDDRAECLGKHAPGEEPSMAQNAGRGSGSVVGHTVCEGTWSR